MNVIRIDGVFYDTQKLAKVHPGGELFVLISNNQDGTALFNSSHRRSFPHDKYKAYQVPASQVPSAKFPVAPTQKFDVYFEICEKVKPLLSNNGFAPTYYYFKAAALLIALTAFEIYFLIYGRTLWLSMIAGLVAGWIGLNVQHDANHGAVSKNGAINRYLGLSQDFIGGSAMGWMISHDTVHHIYCNDLERDHDLDIPFLRLHSKVPWQTNHLVQQIYMWILEMLFGLVHIVYNGFETLKGPNKDQQVFAAYWSTHKILFIANMAKIALNIALWPSMNTLAMFAVFYGFGGFYLAFFFIISHNYQGVKKEGVDATKGCFVRNQVETSSNVGGWFLAQLNGGLNYQIEHHLFPRVHHSNYYYIAPVVRSVCEKHGIQYVHFPTLWDNVASTYLHLKELGCKPL